MRRWVACFLMGLALLMCLATAGFAEMPQTPPLTEEPAQTSGMIRVALTSIGGKGTYNLTISGSYTINGVALGSGIKVKVEFVNGTVYVTANGSRQSMGSSATLSRKSGGVKIAESLAPANVYPGDMRFVYSGGKAYVVCTLFVEEYVYGVLPYEMDNSFPLEALKAQAVTARTYAMRAKTTAGLYDVTDTTNHQVFRGVSGDKKRCIQAVDETWGIVLKHNGQYVNAYYSASNGGQTELNDHVWGGTRLPYFTTAEDPYDLVNPESVKKSYYVYKTPGLGSSISAYAMIKSALAGKLGGSAGQYAIEAVNEMTLHTPMYAVPSRLYTRLRVGVQYNEGQSATVDIPIFPTVEKSLALGINASGNELYTIDAEEKGFRITARRYGHGVGMSQRGAQQMANAGLSYAQILGFYYPGVQRVRMRLTTNWPEEVNIPAINDENDDPVGSFSKAFVRLSDADGRLNLRKEQNPESEILMRIPNGAEVTVLSVSGQYARIQYENASGYVPQSYLEAAAVPPMPTTVKVLLESGSLNLRSEPGESADIIAKIPNGETLVLLETNAGWSHVSYQNQMGYVLSSLISTDSPADGTRGQSTQWTGTALVTLPNPTETVNFRQEPSLDAPILALLPQNTELLVLENGPEWTHAAYQGTAGYVMNAFLRVGAAQSTQKNEHLPSPLSVQAESPTTETKQMATVVLQSGRLNVRKQPNNNADILVKLDPMTRVEVLIYDDTWCAIRLDGGIGYAMRNYLAFDGAPALTMPAAAQVTSNQAMEQAVPAQAPPVSSAPPDDIGYIRTADGDRVNLRRSASTSSTVLVRIPHGSRVDILSYEPKWAKVRYEKYTGYVSTEYLAFDPVASVNAGAGASISTKSGEFLWTRTSDGGSVHLRAEPNRNAQSLSLIPSGSELYVLSTESGWVKVIYKGLTGYVMNEFVSNIKPVGAQAAAQIGANSNVSPSAAQIAAPIEPVANVPAARQESVIGDAKTTILATGKIRLNSPTATLHLKAAPEDLAEETGIAKQGADVEILQYYGDDKRWAFIRCGDVSGYALSEHIVIN